MATSVRTSEAEFDALPYDEGRLWELMDGELVPRPSPTAEHQLILQRILIALTLHLNARPGEGLVLTDVEFALAKDYRVRPDVLVLLRDRAAALDMNRVPVPGAPDLAVEVISPSERSADTQQKLEAYLRYGAREVWKVYPRSKSVVIHRGGSSITLGIGDEISTSLLPGFSLAVELCFRIQL